MAQSSNKHSTPFPVTSVECCSIAPIRLPLWKPNAFSPPCACPFARQPVSNVHNHVESISPLLYSALGCRTCFGWRVISEGDTSKVGRVFAHWPCPLSGSLVATTWTSPGSPDEDEGRLARLSLSEARQPPANFQRDSHPADQQLTADAGGSSVKTTQVSPA